MLSGARLAKLEIDCRAVSAQTPPTFDITLYREIDGCDVFIDCLNKFFTIVGRKLIAREMLLDFAITIFNKDAFAQSNGKYLLLYQSRFYGANAGGNVQFTMSSRVATITYTNWQTLLNISKLFGFYSIGCGPRPTKETPVWINKKFKYLM